MLAQAARNFTRLRRLRVLEPNATVTEGAPGHFGPVRPQVGEESKLDACFCMRLQQRADHFMRTEQANDFGGYVGMGLGTTERPEHRPIEPIRVELRRLHRGQPAVFDRVHTRRDTEEPLAIGRRCSW